MTIIPQQALEKVESVIMSEIDRRSKSMLWRKDRHDLPGAYNPVGNPRFTVKLMPGLSRDLMIRCSSGTSVTYFIYGTNLLGGNAKLTDPEFWKDLLTTIGRTFPRAFRYSSLENGGNKILSLDGYKVKGQKYRFDIDEILPLIPARDVFISDMKVEITAKDKKSKNTIVMHYSGILPFLGDIEQEARIKLSQLRFQDENGEDKDNMESIKTNEANFFYPERRKFDSSEDYPHDEFITSRFWEVMKHPLWN